MCTQADEVLVASRVTLTEARLRRLGWGLRDLPRAVAIVRAARRDGGAS